MIANIKQTLIKEYPYKIELHAHTNPASSCGKASPEELVQLYLDAGFDAVVITNHYALPDFNGLTREAGIDKHLSDYERACKAAEGTKLKIYPGVEIRFTEDSNDYLVYGVDRDIFGKIYEYLDKGVKAFRTEVQLPNSVFVQAHPYRDVCTPADPALLDGVEVFNMHPNHNSRPALAALYATENHIPICTAGTDFHHVKPGYIAAAALRCKALPEDTFALAELLRSGDYIFEIGDKLVF